jgi:hypothetical protein
LGRATWDLVAGSWEAAVMGRGAAMEYRAAGAAAHRERAARMAMPCGCGTVQAIQRMQWALNSAAWLVATSGQSSILGAHAFRRAKPRSQLPVQGCSRTFSEGEETN